MSDLLLILLPGAMYFWVLFAGQAPLQEILQEQESRVLPRLLACPLTTDQYLAAKMLRSFVICAVALGLLIVASRLLFGLHWGNPWKLVVVVTVWAGSMTGLLSCIYAATRTREQANVAAPLVLMFLAMLGGSMFPFENLPPFLQLLGQFTPNRWAVLAMRGVVNARPLADIGRPVALLLGVAILGSTAAFLLFRRRLGGARK
jgi:ABC-2 type transport system permease protein